MPEISTVISTERLVLRGWRESDLEPWAAMSADPEVRRYLGPLPERVDHRPAELTPVLVAGNHGPFGRIIPAQTWTVRPQASSD